MKIKKLTRDKVISLEQDKNLVGVYEAGEDGRDIYFECDVEVADQIIEKFNKKTRPAGILTKKQQETAEFLIAFIKKNKRHPTCMETKKHFGLKAKSTAWNRLYHLKRAIENCPFCNKKL